MTSREESKSNTTKINACEEIGFHFIPLDGYLRWEKRREIVVCAARSKNPTT